MWVIMILSALLTTLGQAGPWGRALGPKVAEEAEPWGLSLGSSHALRARVGEEEVPASGTLQAALLAFIFKTPYHFSGDFFFFYCLRLRAEGGPGCVPLSSFCVPWGPHPTHYCSVKTERPYALC